MITLDAYGRMIDEEENGEEAQSPFMKEMAEMDELDRFFLSESDWLDDDYMNTLWKENREKYSEYEAELQNKFGFGAPLKRNAPVDIIQKYERHGELARILRENGIEN